MFEVKWSDKNIIQNNITLFVFFCQLVKSLRRFSAVSSRSCSKWATNGSPLPVVRNQKLKGREKSLKPLESNLSQTDWVKLNWLKHAVTFFDTLLMPKNRKMSTLFTKKGMKWQLLPQFLVSNFEVNLTTSWDFF